MGAGNPPALSCAGSRPKLGAVGGTAPPAGVADMAVHASRVKRGRRRTLRYATLPTWPTPGTSRPGRKVAGTSLATATATPTAGPREARRASAERDRRRGRPVHAAAAAEGQHPGPHRKWPGQGQSGRLRRRPGIYRGTGWRRRQWWRLRRRCQVPAAHPPRRQQHGPTDQLHQERVCVGGAGAASGPHNGSAEVTHAWVARAFARGAGGNRADGTPGRHSSLAFFWTKTTPSFSLR